MKPIKFILIIFSTCIMIFLTIIIFNLVVDPFGVWNSKIYSGFNNYKYGQEKYNRLFKAYELYETRPDILFLGNSVIQQGFPSKWSEDEVVYNGAFAGGSLSEVEKMVDYTLGLSKKPKTIMIGTTGDAGLRGEFSVERLDFILRSPYHYMFYKVRETLLSSSAVDASIRSVIASFVCPDIVLFDKGWKRNNHFGRIIRSDLSVWRYYLQTAYERYYHHPNINNAILTNKDLAELEIYKRITDKCEKSEVQVIFLVTPINLEESILIELSGKMKFEENYKKKFVDIIPLMDYSILTDQIIDRRNWVDTTHFRETIGEDIIKDILGSETMIKGVLLKKDDFDANISLKRSRYKFYKEANIGLFSLLRDGSYFKLSDAELEGYTRLSNKPMYIEENYNIRFRTPWVQGFIKLIID